MGSTESAGAEVYSKLGLKILIPFFAEGELTTFLAATFLTGDSDAFISLGVDETCYISCLDVIGAEGAMFLGDPLKSTLDATLDVIGAGDASTGLGEPMPRTILAGILFT
jgi:hypothetical protein